MKKIFQILLYLLLLFSLTAGATMAAEEYAWLNVVTGVGGSTPACDDCSGDLMFSWHFENSLDITQGVPCGCVDSGGDSTAEANGPATFDNTYKYDGVYSGDYPGAADYHKFLSSTDANFNHEEGKIIVWVYAVTFVNGAEIYRADNGATNSDFLQLDMTNVDTDITFRAHWQTYNGGTPTNDYATTPTLSTYFAESEWLRVTYQWNRSASAGSQHKIEACGPPTYAGGDCDDSGAQDTIDDWAVGGGSTTRTHWGIYTGVAADIRLDNAQIYANSGL
jgi:hypothetical protein